MSLAIASNEYQKIIDLYINGMKQKEIADMYGVSQTTISSILRRNNICGIINRKFSKKDIDDIIALYSQGMLQKDIARLYNSRQAQISSILTQNNIHGRRLIDINRKNDIIESYKNGMTQEGIASKFFTTPASVMRILEEYDVKIRTRSEAVRTYNFNYNYFDVVDTPNKAYILGLLYADGCNGKNNTVTLNLQERDKDILEKINIEISNTAPLRFINKKSINKNSQNCYCIYFTDAHFSESLDKLGCFHSKSLILKYPTFIDENLQSHFIRGYFDGDGTISKNPKKMSAGFVGTKSFIMTAALILQEKLGCHCYIRCLIEHDDGDDTWDLSITKKHGVFDFLNYIYKDAELYIQRKYDIYKSIYCNAT